MDRLEETLKLSFSNLALIALPWQSATDSGAKKGPPPPTDTSKLQRKLENEMERHAVTRKKLEDMQARIGKSDASSRLCCVDSFP